MAASYRRILSLSQLNTLFQTAIGRETLRRAEFFPIGTPSLGIGVVWTEDTLCRTDWPLIQQLGLPVLAELFPTMTEDELQELAAEDALRAGRISQSEMRRNP
jgi:hypothetical protein